MFEELLMDEEGLKKTENAKIFIGRPLLFDPDLFESQLADLISAAKQEAPDIRERIQKIVPTYQPDLLKKENAG